MNRASLGLVATAVAIGFCANCGGSVGNNPNKDAGGNDAASSSSSGGSGSCGGSGSMPEAGPTVCGAQPAPLSPWIYEPDQIAVDDTYIYVHSFYGLAHFTKAGASTHVGISTPGPFYPELDAFVVVDGNYFFANNAESLVYLEPVAGGEANTVDASIVAGGIARSATHVYVWPQTTGITSIDRVSLDGATTEHAVTSLPAPPVKMIFVGEVGFAATTNGVYEIDFQTKPVLLSALPATDLATDGTSIYFATPSGIAVVSTTTTQTTVVPGSTGAFAVAFGAGDVYFTDTVGNRVRRIRLGSIVDVASVGPTYAPVDIALDDHCVYWTNKGDHGGVVMTMARPP
jgi:hypothetical protein